MPARFSSTIVPQGAWPKRRDSMLSAPLVLEAKRMGHVRTIRAELDKLLETSFFLSQQLYDQLLRMAGEYEG